MKSAENELKTSFLAFKQIPALTSATLYKHREKALLIQKNSAEMSCEKALHVNA